MAGLASFRIFGRSASSAQQRNIDTADRRGVRSGTKITFVCYSLAGPRPLSALARAAEVSLVAPAGNTPPELGHVHHIAAQRSITRLLACAWRVAREHLPIQSLLAAPYDWRAAISRAGREHGPFDVSVVILSRLDPWVRSSLAGKTILDAVDSLRRNAAERARQASGARRSLWRMEEERMRLLESGESDAYGMVVVLNESEREEFGRAVAVPNGVEIHELSAHTRTYDFGFWGRFPYFANADATRRILTELWPAIRQERPDATMILGGAEASSSLRDAARSAGVTLLSPVEDIPSFARMIRIALMPVHFGTGQLNKILEAAEAGCAIVATPEALRGLEPLAPFARVESTSSGLVAAAIELFDDERQRAERAAGLRQAVETTFSRETTLHRLLEIARGVAA
jgi:glycosyltransferase involved in cell wall biosynthesis